MSLLSDKLKQGFINPSSFLDYKMGDSIDQRTSELADKGFSRWLSKGGSGIF